MIRKENVFGEGLLYFLVLVDFEKGTTKNEI